MKTLLTPPQNSHDIATGNAHSRFGRDMNSSLDSATIPNLEVVKARQKATWESGDFGQIARTIENVAADFMARQPLQPGSRVLDVACGTGNLAVIAARRGCAVSGIDIAGNLIVQARARAAAEGLRIDFKEADAEALPFLGNQFDLVASMFGAMFAPRPSVVAAELLRVTKPGGQVALANWTPEGFIGKMFGVFKAHLPPPPAGVPSPMIWGDEATVRSRLQQGFAVLRLTRRIALMRYPFPPAETVEFFRQYYGPTQRAFASLEVSAQAALRQASHEVASAWGGVLPAVTLDYWYGIDANQFATRTPDHFSNLGSSAAATLQLPIWSWGANLSKLKQANLQKKQAVVELSAAQRTLLANVRSFYDEAQAARSELELLSQSAQLASESLRLTSLRYQSGEATVLEVVDAQNALTAASNAYDDGQVRFRVALANLQTLTGKF